MSKEDKVPDQKGEPAKVRINVSSLHLPDTQGLHSCVVQRDEILEGDKLTPFLVMTVMSKQKIVDFDHTEKYPAELIGGEFSAAQIAAAKKEAESRGIKL